MSLIFLIMSMKLQNTTEDQIMVSYFYFFKIKPFSLIASAIVLSLVFYSSFSCFGFGFSSILFTTLLLIVSTLIFKLITKKKPVTDQETLSSDHETSSNESEAVAKPAWDHKEQEQQEGDDELKLHEYSIKSLSSTTKNFMSENESLNHLSSSEESDVDWPFREIVYKISPDCSDEENDLIEISLPSGHYVGNYNKDQEEVLLNPKFHFSKQHGLMEILATEIYDMNEEDNLIEIDISMGSIKCSSFEIEA